MKAFRHYWIIIILISSILTKFTTEDHIERKRTLDYIVDRNVFTIFKEEGISLKKAVARDHAPMIKNQPLKTAHSSVHSSQEDLKKQERLLENRSNKFKSLEQNIDETKRRWIIQLAERQRFVEERKDGLLRFATLKNGDSEDLISSSRLKRSVKRNLKKWSCALKGLLGALIILMFVDLLNYFFTFTYLYFIIYLLAHSLIKYTYIFLINIF